MYGVVDEPAIDAVLGAVLLVDDAVGAGTAAAVDVAVRQDRELDQVAAAARTVREREAFAVVERVRVSSCGTAFALAFVRGWRGG